MNIFKKKTSPKDALRVSKREMAVATRGIEREIASLQLEEKKLVAEIKQTAKTGNEAATKILARQLVRLRQQITNLQGSRAQIRGVATHTQALYASTSISTGMKGATKAMVAMNKQMAPAKQAKVIKEFQKQSAQLDMTIEMMSESIDETLDKDEAEEETEELTNQVLDEIGVDIASQLSSAPKGRIASKNASNAVKSVESPLKIKMEEKELAVRDGTALEIVGKEETETNTLGSEEMELNIAHIVEKIEHFTQMVSELLESGKTMFKEMSHEFEERLIMIHKEKMEKWQEEIRELRMLDASNEEDNAILHNARYLLQNPQIDS